MHNRSDVARKGRARFVLFKHSVITAHDSHFAGGKHAFSCMANTLAAEGFDVHLVSIASKGKVLMHASVAGLLPLLSFVTPGVVTWRENNVRHHVFLSEEVPAQGSRAGPALADAVSSYVKRLTTPAEPSREERPSATQHREAAFPDGSQEDLAGTSAPEPSMRVHDGGQRPATPRSDLSGDRSSGAAAGHAGRLRGAWVIVDADESQKLLQAASPGSKGTSPLSLSASSAVSPSPRPPHQELQEELRTPGDVDDRPSTLPNGTPYGNGNDNHNKKQGSRIGQGSSSAPAPGDGGDCAKQATTPDETTLFEALVAAAPPWRCLALVQNVHFLPMGPSGTGPRRTALLSAWASLGAVLAVSEFIAGYVRQYWHTPPSSASPQPPQLLLPQPPLPPPPPVRVVPLATWGVFGRPPFPDLAAVARPLLQDWRAAQTHLENPPGGPTSGQPHAQAPPAPPPPLPPPVVVDVAVLKLTPEKGAPILVALARRLAGRVRFRVVAGNPSVEAALAPLTEKGWRPNDREGAPVPAHASSSSSSSSASSSAAAASASSAAPVVIWEPQPDVSLVLSGCVAVLAPSLWLEAWGMVVTEALLRGIPAIVSDLGGLPEAGMGLCPAVPVDPLRIPPDAADVPNWAARTYPKQDADAWERALLSLLLDSPVQSAAQAGAAAGCAAAGGGGVGGGVGGAGSCVRGGGAGSDGDGGAWERLSLAGRAAALEHVLQGREFLGQWLEWLGGLQ